MRSLSAFVDAGTMDIFCEMTHLFNIVDVFISGVSLIIKRFKPSLSFGFENPPR